MFTILITGFSVWNTFLWKNYTIIQNGMEIIMAKKKIPEINLIDLDRTAAPDWDTFDAAAKEGPEDDREDFSEEEELPEKRGFRLNLHIVLIAVILLTVSVIYIRFSNWGQFVDPSTNLGDSETEDDTEETLDSILPLTDADGVMIAPDLSDGLSIAVFGNAPFADDRDSGDSLAAMVAELSDATVYNFSIGGSSLACTQPFINTELNPWDAFNFYWMALLTSDMEVDDYFDSAISVLGESAPQELSEVHALYSGVDFDAIDIFVILYDAADYLAGIPVSNSDNPTDIQTFAGNLRAGIEVLKSEHPNARIIVMSAPYAFSAEQDENGNYISSDTVLYGENALSAYVSREAAVCSQQQVSFVDNLYGTFSEGDAAEYLTDNRHLNTEGRRKLAERLVRAITYFDSYYE